MILELMVNIASDILLPTGKFILALDKKLTYGKLDQEQSSTISIQVVIYTAQVQLRYEYVGT